MTAIEKCPACFGSGRAGRSRPGLGWGFGDCQRCEGTGLRTQADRIDPTGKDVFAIYGVAVK